jgi:hypothetical protein
MTAAHRTSRLLAATVVSGLGLASAAHAAAPSTFSESRGYQNCVDAAEQQTRLLGVDGRYFIYEHDDSRHFYLNGHAREDRRSVPVKISCLTNRSGTRVLEVAVNGGHYAGRLVEPVGVASN